MALNQCTPDFNKGLISNDTKFTEVYLMCTEKHVLVKK